jgi:DNA invertase Pin-like site-specific DNA recombinase
MQETFVAYYRVSTAKQGESGLGLEAQRDALYRFTHDPNSIIAEFTELESGRKKFRPQLLEAIAHAKERNATLLIAKLDRLARNVSFVSELMESKVKFKAVDMPQADNFTIHIIAAVAEREAEMISARTKAALERKKKRIADGIYTTIRTSPDGQPILMKPDRHGVYRLGNPHGYTLEMQEKAIAAIKQKAAANKNTKMAIKRVKEVLERMPDASLSELAEALNEYNLKTPSGKRFSRFNVAYLKKLI